MTNKSTATTNGNCSSAPTDTSQTVTTSGANTTSVPASESNNNNAPHLLSDDSNKILAGAQATQQLAELQRAPRDGPTPPPALEPQAGGGAEPQQEASSDIERQLNKEVKIEPSAGAGGHEQSSFKSEHAPPTSDGNNNQEAERHGHAAQVKREPVELAPGASLDASAGTAQRSLHQMMKSSGELQGAGSESGPALEAESHEGRLGPHDTSPEYTMLKPVTPTGSQQQPQLILQQTAHQHHPQASSTLTDLDAAGQRRHPHAADEANTHAQNGSQQHVESANITIEQQQHQQQQQQPPPPLAPLTELTPAAVGSTFSELTSVNPVTIEHHPQQQYMSEQHDSQQQQQHTDLNLVGSGGQPIHQMAYASVASYQLSGTGLLQEQQAAPQTLTSLGACPSDNPPGSAFSQQESAQPANVLPPSQRFQTTGPPSASSVTSSGGMTTPTGAGGPGSTAGGSTTGGGGSKRRSWSQASRNANKTEIAKVYSQFGFRCYLEAPISTCRRKEEDRITYINKGEFYGLTLDYVPDAARPLRSSIVKAVVMLVFRDEKTPDEDLKSWQFWHSRQHSAKQRILDVDNKNHVNVINQIEEISLNAIAFYWNPVETRQAKLNIAIQCLSTDFSNQKGVKGLPLNLQVDIYDLFTETSTPVYRAYSTLLSYCDKGAQRRSRDEERRVLKRKLADQSGGSAAGAAKKFDDLYHKPCDRTEFYAMADLIKAPTLYSPTEAEALGLAAQGAASDTNSSSGANTNPSIKQPMSQTSAISVTPIAATTPIPATIIHDPQQQQQQQTAQLIQQQQPVGLGYGQATGGPVGSAQQLAQGARGGLPQAQFAHSPYTSTAGAIVTGDYMAPVVASGTPVVQGSQMIASLGPNSQQQQTGSMAQQQQLHQMIGQAATIHHQHHQVANQHQHQQQHQQQQHHYHQMTSSTLQPSYGIIQTGQPVVDQSQQQQQQQQYAILQPSLGMSVHHSASGATHIHSPHANQYATHQQQQPMMTSGSGQQQQHSSLDGNRGQMHQGSMMMAGGMVQQPQQQHQIQAQHGQYMAAGAPPPPANNLVNLTSSGSIGQHQQHQQPLAKRPKLYPNERVLIYAKQADEKDFYPLHLSPPSLSGLVYAIEQKYKIDSTKVANIYKKSKKGIRVQMDDEMIRHYCNEDMVQLEVVQTQDSRLEITLVEL